MPALVERLDYGKPCVSRDGPIAPGSEHGILAHTPGFPGELIALCDPSRLGIAETADTETSDPERRGIVVRTFLTRGQLWTVAMRTRLRPEGGEGTPSRLFTMARYLAVPTVDVSLIALLRAFGDGKLPAMTADQARRGLTGFELPTVEQVQLNRSQIEFCQRAVKYLASGIPVAITSPIGEVPFVCIAEALRTHWYASGAPPVTAGWGVSPAVAEHLHLSATFRAPDTAAEFVSSAPMDQQWREPTRVIASRGDRRAAVAVPKSTYIPGLAWSKNAPNAETGERAAEISKILKCMPPNIQLRDGLLSLTRDDVQQATRQPGETMAQVQWASTIGSMIDRNNLSDIDSMALLLAKMRVPHAIGMVAASLAKGMEAGQRDELLCGVLDRCQAETGSDGLRSELRRACDRAGDRAALFLHFAWPTVPEARAETIELYLKASSVHGARSFCSAHSGALVEAFWKVFNAFCAARANGSSMFLELIREATTPNGFERYGPFWAWAKENARRLACACVERDSEFDNPFREAMNKLCQNDEIREEPVVAALLALVEGEAPPPEPLEDSEAAGAALAWLKYRWQSPTATQHQRSIRWSWIRWFGLDVHAFDDGVLWCFEPSLKRRPARWQTDLLRSIGANNLPPGLEEPVADALIAHWHELPREAQSSNSLSAFIRRCGEPEVILLLEPYLMPPALGYRQLPLQRRDPAPVAQFLRSWSDDQRLDLLGQWYLHADKWPNSKVRPSPDGLHYLARVLLCDSIHRGIRIYGLLLEGKWAAKHNAASPADLELSANERKEFEWLCDASELQRRIDPVTTWAACSCLWHQQYTLEWFRDRDLQIGGESLRYALEAPPEQRAFLASYARDDATHPDNRRVLSLPQLGSFSLEYGGADWQPKYARTWATLFFSKVPRAEQNPESLKSVLRVLHGLGSGRGNARRQLEFCRSYLAASTERDYPWTCKCVWDAFVTPQWSALAELKDFVDILRQKDTGKASSRVQFDDVCRDPDCLIGGLPTIEGQRGYWLDADFLTLAIDVYRGFDHYAATVEPSPGEVQPQRSGIKKYK